MTGSQSSRGTRAGAGSAAARPGRRLYDGSAVPLDVGHTGTRQRQWPALGRVQPTVVASTGPISRQAFAERDVVLRAFMLDLGPDEHERRIPAEQIVGTRFRRGGRSATMATMATFRLRRRASVASSRSPAPTCARRVNGKLRVPKPAPLLPKVELVPAGVDPTIELAADLAQDTDQFEPEGLVERRGSRIGLGYDGNRAMHPVFM